jgi:hypothetical protein
MFFNSHPLIWSIPTKAIVLSGQISDSLR